MGQQRNIVKKEKQGETLVIKGGVTIRLMRPQLNFVFLRERAVYYGHWNHVSLISTMDRRDYHTEL